MPRLHQVRRCEGRAEAQRPSPSVKVSGATMSRGSAIRELMKACIGKPRLVAATSAASQREVIQRVLGLSDVDKFVMVLLDEASQAIEASLMLTSTTEWFIDVELLVSGGEHLQLSLDIQSDGESPFGNIPKMSPLERLTKSCHDRPLVSPVHEYGRRVQIYRLAPAVMSRIDSESPA